jgi:hypothetical protein
LREELSVGKPLKRKAEPLVGGQSRAGALVFV